MAALVDYKKWCGKKEVSPEKSIVVGGVPRVGYSDDTVKNHLKQIADVRIIDHRETEDDTFEVLCTFKAATSGLPLPSNLAIGDGIIWAVIQIVPAAEEQPIFDELLADFLKAHGKGDYLEQLKQKGTDKGGNGEGVQHEHIQHIVSTPQHRRIRPFSGKSPVPNGEWDFDTWDQVVTQSIIGSNMTPTQKRSTVIDSLMPPALDVVRDIGSGPANELLTALRKAYGMVKDGDDLYAEFRDTYQGPEEKPSDFLVRLNKLLGKTIQRGGLPSSRADRSRLDQFVRGCLFHEDLVLDLQLRQKKANPPAFVDLLQEVRSEEERRAERDRRRADTQQKSPATKQAKVHQQSARESKLESQVEELKRQVSLLQVQATAPPAPVVPPTRPHHRTNNQRRPLFCYKCGEDGHGMRACNGAANATLVQQKLLARMGSGQGNAREPPRRDERGAQ